MTFENFKIRWIVAFLQYPRIILMVWYLNQNKVFWNLVSGNIIKTYKPPEFDLFSTIHISFFPNHIKVYYFYCYFYNHYYYHDHYWKDVILSLLMESLLRFHKYEYIVYIIETWKYSNCITAFIKGWCWTEGSYWCSLSYS